jgi:hypothetical protein
MKQRRMKMNIESKQYKYLKRLLKINPKLTVGQASHRLKLMEEFIMQRV